MMAAKSPIALILGAGPNVGQAVARKFASNGYKVALAARSVKEAESSDDQLNITTDLSKTEDVVSAFDKVKKTFGIPSVVVYNDRSQPATLSIQSTDATHPALPPSPHLKIHSPCLWRI
jgi:NAD(P)-dependent dehydrogenase (short-subunit alcohol dehydrogenase family)